MTFPFIQYELMRQGTTPKNGPLRRTRLYDEAKARRTRVERPPLYTKPDRLAISPLARRRRDRAASQDGERVRGPAAKRH